MQNLKERMDCYLCGYSLEKEIQLANVNYAPHSEPSSLGLWVHFWVDSILPQQSIIKIYFNLGYFFFLVRDGYGEKANNSIS